MIRSPIKYTGNKYKLLPQILKHFPEDIEVFLDLFCGSGTVAINVKSDAAVCNDISFPLINLLRYLQRHSPEEIMDGIKGLIMKYQLSRENKPGFENLRKSYSKTQSPLELFTLICYSFNSLMRFNSKGGFNVPFGRKEFNEFIIRKNLEEFHRVVSTRPFIFTCGSYINTPLNLLSKRDFIYIDPPYLISNAVYNKQWGVEEERNLLAWLDLVNAKGLRFALSNVTHHKGLENEILVKWSRKYNVHEIQSDYSNCNYQVKVKGSTREVLITNY